jgi:glutamate dehydrogenase/leucine dehydrogenase
MVSAFEEVSILMEQRKTSMRMAAFAVAIDRVAQAYALRGI